MNDLEIKAFENEKKVSDIEFTMQQHILQYQLALKQQKRKEKNSRLALNNNNNNAPAATVVIGKLFPHYRYIVWIDGGAFKRYSTSVVGSNGKEGGSSQILVAEGKRQMLLSPQIEVMAEHDSMQTESQHGNKNLFYE